MSIAVLTQLYDETKRLAVAGSLVAAGDFRLKKLLPPLEAAGAKAPVFAKVAEGVKAVVDGPEKQSAQALLDLTALVSAVLYTQGETGIAGKLEPLETVDLGAEVVQTSARILKPLLEAFATTGSGRLEIIKDAVDRNLFRDLRLVKPALKAIEDPYSEIADLICDKVLPTYGRAILGELKAKYDPKGKVANARRLKLMHRIDPVGTRPLVEAAVEDAIKEVKVAAIGCLGAEDLTFLLDAAKGKAVDVRCAAYRGLARSNDPTALAALAAALAGKDLEYFWHVFTDSTIPEHSELIVRELDKKFAALADEKDKAKVSAILADCSRLLRYFPKAATAVQEKYILDLFARRDELAKIKGATNSGTDLVETIVKLMAGSYFEGTGSKVLQNALVDARDGVPVDVFEEVVDAARSVTTPARVFDLFSPYFQEAKSAKGKAAEDAKKRTREIVAGLDGLAIRWYSRHDADKKYPLDPRWVDVAVEHDLLSLLSAVEVKNHPKANEWLNDEFKRAMRGKTKSGHDLEDLVMVIVVTEHPKATEHFLEAYLHEAKKKHTYLGRYHQALKMLPKSALPTLEAALPDVPKEHADNLLEAIDELRRS